VLEGLARLDQAAGARFADLPDARAGAILDRISDPKTEDPQAAAFFRRFRSICVTGFYTTPEGWADLGYVGNKPAASFPDPPPEVLARLKLPLSP
jgi:gluconate 2-dehydrogenase gamma chain